MDDSGFQIGRTSGAGAQAIPAPSDWIARPAATAVRRRRPPRAWTWGVAVAALLHVAMLAPIMMARGVERDRLARVEPMTIYIDMVPPPKPAQAEPKAPPKADSPPPVQAKPTPLTPRESVQPLTPPPMTSPFVPLAPEPVAAPARPEPAARAPAPAEPSPAPAGPSTSAARADFNGRVMAALARAKRYPPAARARREQGTATLAITISRAGRVLNAEVTKSSGSDLLDRAALETARRANMPRVPAELSDPVRVVVALEFAVKSAG